MEPMKLKEKLKSVCGARYLLIVNLIFAVAAVVGQVGQNVSLPLWASATTSFSNPNCTTLSDNESNKTNSTPPQMDPYFVLSSASFSFVVIFGFSSLMIVLVQSIFNLFAEDNKKKYFITVKDDLLFPQWQLFLVGLFDALNGVFVVFASPPLRTAPFLQAILGNSLIPLTILFRFILLRKRPTLLKFFCALAVVLGLILSLIPVVAGFDAHSKSGNSDFFNQPILSRILWPMCFMIGFLPAALMNVIEEKSLKDTRNVNLFYFLFCTSSYQLLFVGLLFWADIIPEFGFANGSIQTFGENYWFAIQCFFGQAGCNYVPGLRGVAFISMYVVSYIGGGLLIRYAEGATYLAVVQALVTPLGALFWSLFEEDSCGNFFFQPNADSLTYFSIGGLIIMVPAIFLYNIGTFGTMSKLLLSFTKCVFGDDSGYTCACLERQAQKNVQDEEERKPILTASTKYNGEI